MVSMSMGRAKRSVGRQSFWMQIAWVVLGFMSCVYARNFYEGASAGGDLPDWLFALPTFGTALAAGSEGAAIGAALYGIGHATDAVVLGGSAFDIGV